MARLPLNTHPKARGQLAKIIREYKLAPEEERDHKTFRNLCYAFSVLLKYFEMQEGLRLEEKLDEMLEYIETLEIAKQRQPKTLPYREVN